MIMFDLPVKTAKQRKIATQFRKFLLKDGYYMLQFSVYARICNGTDAVDMHKKRLNNNLPENGSIRLLVMTEKQFETMEILVGKFKEEDTEFVCQQLSIF